MVVSTMKRGGRNKGGKALSAEVMQLKAQRSKAPQPSESADEVQGSSDEASDEDELVEVDVSGDEEGDDADEEVDDGDGSSTGGSDVSMDEDVAEVPLSSGSRRKKMALKSKIFCPNKAVGLVSLDTAFLLNYSDKHKGYYLSVPLGNALHVYSVPNMKLRGVSKPLKAPVTCVASGSLDVTATKDGCVQTWRKGTTHVQATRKLHDAEIHLLTVIGDAVVTVDVENVLKVSTVQGESHLEKRLPLNSFHVSAIIHPTTYMNKIVLGSNQGKLLLYNFKHDRDIYTFSGWGSAVRVMAQPTVQHIVGIGLADGRIYLHNLQTDASLMCLQQTDGAVSALSFRSDNNERLLSGSRAGAVHVWNLAEKSLMASIKKAHDGPIVSLDCAHKEPLAYTASTDNAIRCWSFDLSDGGGRMISSREGHSEPPLRVRYHGEHNCEPFSAGRDSCIRTNDVRTSYSTLISKSIVSRMEKNNRKDIAVARMPPIVAFKTESIRDKSFDSLAALHENSKVVTTYSIYLKKMNDRKLCHERFEDQRYKEDQATCLEISACGNFVYVGYTSGHIDKFNIQSGEFRQTYGTKKTRHKAALGGVATDALNLVLVSGDQDGTVCWWCQHKATPQKTLELPAGVCSLTMCRGNGLFALACDDFCIYVADSASRSVVRTFKGHTNAVTDCAFTPDFQWLISTSLDSTIRTWDVPTGHAIDVFSVPAPASSVAVSPMQDAIATTHFNELGVYVWVNKSFLSCVSLEPLPKNYKVPQLPLPGCSYDDMFDSESEESDSEDEQESKSDVYKSPDALNDKFITIDSLPASRWLNLKHIDNIRKRNKPQIEAKAPEAAPYFLDTVEVGPNHEKEKPLEPEETTSSAAIVKGEFAFESYSEFGTHLKNDQLDDAFKMLLDMGPSAIDLEIQNLDPDMAGSAVILRRFVAMLARVLATKRHCEAAHGYLALFLRRHGVTIAELKDEDLHRLMETLLQAVNESSAHFTKTLDKCTCYLNFLKDSALFRR